MNSARLEWNELLWLLKRPWLEGCSVEEQWETSLVVADLVDEENEPEQAAIIRSGRWLLWYDASANRYYVAAERRLPHRRLAWPIHWFPATASPEFGLHWQRPERLAGPQVQHDPPMEIMR